MSSPTSPLHVASSTTQEEIMENSTMQEEENIEDSTVQEEETAPLVSLNRTSNAAILPTLTVSTIDDGELVN